MERDTDRYRTFTRRMLVLGAGKAALLSLLVGRMYHLQVVEADRLGLMAEENRINLRLIAPSRGLIYDRFGVPLAVNRQNFRVLVIAEKARDVERTLERLSRIVPLSEGDWRRIERELDRKRAFVPVTVRENLSWEQVSRLEVNLPDLPGVSIDVGEIRSYPFGPATAHILGYVGVVSESELTGDPVLALPGFRIGKTGIERHHDAVLRGEAGSSQLEVNAVGRVIRELSRNDGKPGREVTLTIDIGFQQYVQDRLAHERSASCVVMDVHSGGLYAAASSPSFDPNLFARGIDSATWNQLLSDPHAPMTNKTIAGRYAPGSTFKMVVALAALEAGLISPGHGVLCPGFTELGNHRFHCWKRGGHGMMGLAEAIRESCDVFFYDLGRRLGIDRIADMGRRLGLGQELGIELPGEVSGLLPTRDWKLATIGERWQQGEDLIAAIGQGFVLATPLQLAVMTARLVNGGRAIQPHLTRHIQGIPQDPGEWPAIGVGKANLDLLMDAMIQVTEHRRGTAHASRIPEPGFEMGGKTGTSQVKRITLAERAAGIVRQEDRPWRDRHHALFVGFAPISAPRYACAVVVEHGGSGSKAAAPIARDVLFECQKRNPARPTASIAAEPDGPA